jgi:hypothetical protein
VVAPLYPITSSYDGQRITVDDYLKDPLRIPALVLDIMQNEFIIETVLRNAGNNVSGAVRYEQSTPLFANKDATIRAEFAEVPAVTGSVGELLVAYSYERALAIMVSDEMRRRQLIDPVTRQLVQTKNTMIKDWNQAFFSLLLSTLPSTQFYSISSGEAWDGTESITGGTGASAPLANLPFIIRNHISDAIFLVENAALPQQPQNFFGFNADTLIIDHVAKLALFKSQDFARPYIGDVASSSIQYTGLMPRQIMGLDVLVSRQCPTGLAFVCQRNRFGFVSDEVPLTATPLYRDEPKKTWRSDIQRASAMGIDQPFACVVIQGVTGTIAGGGQFPAPGEQSGIGYQTGAYVPPTGGGAAYLD